MTEEQQSQEYMPPASYPAAFGRSAYPEWISQFWMFQAAGWGAYAIVLLVSNLPFLGSRGVLAYRGASLVACFAASFVLHAVCRRQWRMGLRFPRSFLIVFAWCAGLAYVCAWLAFEAENFFN